jgi:hypothetical protein
MHTLPCTPFLQMFSSLNVDLDVDLQRSIIDSHPVPSAQMKRAAYGVEVYSVLHHPDPTATATSSFKQEVGTSSRTLLSAAFSGLQHFREPCVYRPLFVISVIWFTLSFGSYGITIWISTLFEDIGDNNRISILTSVMSNSYRVSSRTRRYRGYLSKHIHMCACYFARKPLLHLLH